MLLDREQATDSYADLILRVRDLVHSSTPEGATVAVVSRGDSELLRLTGRAGWHFPRTPTGVYAGHHPTDDADAIARLEAARSDGAGYLVLPATAYWWLDHYAGFRRHLDSRYPRVAERAGTAIVFSLAGEPVAPNVLSAQNDGRSLENLRALARALLPQAAQVLVATGGDERLLDLGGPTGWHFPQLEGGYYAGDDPADSAAAVAHLEVLRVAGAEYLVIPQTAHWWLEHYPEFRAHLEKTCSLVTRQENVGTIFGLLHPSRPAGRKRRAHA